MKINLPFIVAAGDYHEFDSMEQNFQLLSPLIEVKEIGFSGGQYIGVVYNCNRKPTVEESREMAASQGYPLDL